MIVFAEGVSSVVVYVEKKSSILVFAVGVLNGLLELVFLEILVL